MAAAAKRRLPVGLRALSDDNLQKVRGHLRGLIDIGLQEIPDLNALDEQLAACLAPAASAASKGGGGEEAPLAAGQRVQINGIKSAVELNGQYATVLKFDAGAGRYVVELEGDGGQKSLKRQNLTAVAGGGSSSSHEKVPSKARVKPKAAASPPAGDEADFRAGEFTVGDRVRVGGLNGAIELNGQLAVVFAYDKAANRYLVEFENGQGQRKLQAKNLTAMGVATGALAAKARMFAQMGAAG
eukprot:TRINITY_DN78800_c0_g1_i1.p1 TRINITY_DN78800_c0_g1~~TRINITY_DN78800_c0_g1_i1.p1  ORF type:complete len:242 (+),score=51.82 TRINITY_DN78800_c0_g1_i1:122-847(+)